MASDIFRIEAVLKRADSQGLAFSAPPSDHTKSPKGLVVLLGWLGAQERYLNKYSDFLLQDGFATVRSICPTKYLFWPTSRPRWQWAKDILQYLTVVNSDPPVLPVILYAFSNGGAFVVEEMCKILRSWPKDLPSIPIRAIIFDSSPAYMYMSDAIKATTVSRPPMMKALVALAVIFVLLLGSVVNPGRPRSFWTAMEALGPLTNIPALYLYSKDDSLCNSKDLKSLIDLRKAAGRPVREKMWRHSEHISHFRRHPNEYTSIVLDFLNVVVQS